MSEAVPVRLPSGSPFRRSSGFGVSTFLMSFVVTAADAGDGAVPGVWLNAGNEAIASVTAKMYFLTLSSKWPSSHKQAL